MNSSARCAMTCFTSDAAFITAGSPSTRTSCHFRTTATDLRMAVDATPTSARQPAMYWGRSRGELSRPRVRPRPSAASGQLCAL